MLVSGSVYNKSGGGAIASGSGGGGAMMSGGSAMGGAMSGGDSEYISDI